ncbi:MAG: GNAT family N-acetyltransferase [Saccharospirillum sp.]
MMFAAMAGQDLQWQCRAFDQLDTQTLYRLLQLRTQVFVVEQNCPYQDLDGRDFEAWHLLGFQQGELVALARLLPPQGPNGAVSIGRVITAATVRGQGLGDVLMRRAVQETERRFPQQAIHLSAQAHLVSFYARFGFVAQGSNYLEDGIEHCLMIRPASLTASVGAPASVPA